MLALVLVLSAPTGDAATAESFAASGEAHLLEAVSNGHPLDAFDEAHKNFETAFLLGADSQYLCRAVETAELALRTATMNKDTRTSWQEIWRDDMKRLRAEASQQGRANCRYDGKGDRLPPRVELLADAGGPLATEPASPAAPPGPVPQDRRPSAAARGLLIGGGLLLAASAALGGVAASGYVQRERLVDQERALAADAWGLGYADGATYARARSASACGGPRRQRRWHTAPVQDPAGDDTVKLDPGEPTTDHAAGGARQQDTDEFPEHLQLGRFTLVRLLGRGGMGVVYTAYDNLLDRVVAIKMVRRDRADVHLFARVLREAKALAKLSHPNVVPIFDVGEVVGEVFIAMEYVEGPTLRAWLAERRAAGAGARELLDVLIQAGRGLAAAHAAGFVHRDFKPKSSPLPSLPPPKPRNAADSTISGG